MMTEPIDPEGIRWSRVSPKLIILVRLRSGLSALAILAILAVPLLLAANGAWRAVPVWLPFLTGLVFVLWRMLLIPRQVRAIGFAERAEDLLIRRGIFFRRLLVVPYGRMQYVDVTAGPVERWLGLATVKLHTAAPGTHALIPGLAAHEAARLREQLSALGESKLAGL